MRSGVWVLESGAWSLSEVWVPGLQVSVLDSGF